MTQDPVKIYALHSLIIFNLLKTTLTVVFFYDIFKNPRKFPWEFLESGLSDCFLVISFRLNIFAKNTKVSHAFFSASH